MDLVKSMPASAANTLERLEKMGHFKAWSHMDDSEKHKVLGMVEELTKAIKTTESAGRTLWRYMERR